MDISSDNQSELIEAYVTGQMSPEQEDKFEAYILSRPDWQEEIEQARQLFKQIHQQEWELEIAQRFEKLKRQEQTQSLLAQLLEALSKPFNLVSHAVVFGLGLWLMSAFVPQTSDTMPGIGKVQGVNLVTARSVGNEQADTQEVPLDKGIDTLVFNIPVADILRDSYYVGINSQYQKLTLTDVKADANKKLKLSVAVEYLKGSHVEIKLHDNLTGELLREHKIKLIGH